MKREPAEDKKQRARAIAARLAEAYVVRQAHHSEGTRTVDTHCKRVSRHFGLTKQDDPNKIEQDLMKLLPPEEWTGFSHRLILHGRRVCYARKPDCKACVVNDLCPSATL